jgi:hypothetical protein
MWCIEPFLSGDSATAIVSGQRLGKQFPAAANTQATEEIPLETACFYVVRTEML